MSSTRKSKKKKGYQGDGTRFIAIPHQVLESNSYLNLSHPARSLLLEIAAQYVGSNNGSLLCSRGKLLARGWGSNDVLTRAKRELIAAGFIFETVKGQRPNRASWYALTWYGLDKHSDYDAGVVGGFQRSAYKYTSGSAQFSMSARNNIVLPNSSQQTTDTTNSTSVKNIFAASQLRIRPDLLHANDQNAWTPNIAA